MGEREYDVAWLDEMKRDEGVADFAKAFRWQEEDCVEVLLKVACQPEDVLRKLEDEERRARIAFEDVVVACGLIKRAKVAFENVAFQGEGREEATALLVWLVPSGTWEDFAYWKEDGARKRDDVLLSLGRALVVAFGVDIDSPFFASQMETTAEMLSLANDFPFLLSSLGQVDWCELDTLNGKEVFKDILRRCNCMLKPCALDYGDYAWHLYVDMPHSGYSRGMAPFFEDERTLADNYARLEEDLAAFRSSYRGGKKYVVIFTVFALRPSFSFIAEGGQSDIAATLERALVSVGFCESASFSEETFLGKVISRRCNVRAVVDAGDIEVARDMPFVFRKAIVDIFQQTCGCLVVELRISNFSDVFPLFPAEEDF